MEKFSSARRSTIGIAAPTKFLWKGTTGRDNRNTFYIRLQIKIDIRHESAKTRWILIERKKLLTVMFHLFSVAKTFPSSTSYNKNRAENTSKCRKKSALQYFKRPDVRDRHNAFCWGLPLYVVPSPQVPATVGACHCSRYLPL